MSAAIRLGIVCYPSLGGSGIVATELGMTMARRGHEVHCISSDHPFRLAADAEGIFVHQVEVPGYPLFQEPPHMLAMATKIADVVQVHDLDLIHVHYAVPHAISAYLARQMLAPRRLPVMLTLHGTDITIVGAEPSYKPAVHFGLIAADHVTAVSQSLAQSTREIFDVSRDIEVIPNFVDVQEFRPPSAPLGFEGPMVLAHASNFRPVKRPHDVLTVFESLRQYGPVRLLLAGEGPELSSIEQRVKARGLTRDVSFLGAVVDLARILPRAHLFLLPSASESFGLAALEAMACGVPVIGTNTGGLPETVIDGRTGLLFAVGDTAAMARGAHELLSDAPRYLAMREHARSNACERFERERIASRYEMRYRELLARSMSPGAAPPPPP